MLNTIHRIFMGLLFTVLLLLTKPVKGQEIYLCTETNEIYRLDSGYILTLVTTALYPKALTDIAFSSEGNLYGIAKEDIVEINLQTGETTLLKQLPAYDYSYAMGCSDEDKLFVRGYWSSVLYAYDLPSEELQLINYLGSDQTYDMTFYKGNLMYQSSYKHAMYIYDLTEQTFSKIACQPNGMKVEGMSSLMDSCGAEHVYLVDQYSSLYEVNFEERILDHLHNFPTLEFRFSGMASHSEHIGSTCYSMLQSVSCSNYGSVGLNEVDTNSTVNIFPNPASSSIHIHFGDPLYKSIGIVDVHGRKILQVKTEGSNEIETDISQLPEGIYFVNGIIADGTLSYLGKFLKN